MKYVTIKDIAKKLNLSVSTISRAFNDKYDIKPETRDLILQTAKEMNYRPNPIARKLIRQRSYNIGIVVPEFENSFFPKVIIGAQEVLFEKGYQVLITQSNESEAVQRHNIESLMDNMVDGLLVSLTSDSKDIEFYERLSESGVPIVFFNRVVDIDNVSKVVFDDFKWSFFATEHLLKQGCRNISFLAGQQSLPLTRNRLKGFKAAHAKYQVPHGNIEYCGFTMEEGRKAMEKLIQNNQLPDAIFAANDPSAVGAMQVLKEYGIKVPEEVAIVGFTESRVAPHTVPALTSVAQPTHEMGRQAAKLLIEQIENKEHFTHQTITLNGKLNVRASSEKYVVNNVRNKINGTKRVILR
ncbi:LacI family transcriptional regulator [Puteibacter caeruleilacunae]|nr:LacI family transcriptional regulator [Puteibacter caeruleilacunae]